MIELLAKGATYGVIRIVGFSFLAAYLVGTGDLSFSPRWAAGYVVIAIVTAYAVAALRLPTRWPWLDRRKFSAAIKVGAADVSSNDEWALKQATYLDAGVGKNIFYTPAEDGLICVPILCIGIGPVSAVLAGVFFGFLHLGRFTYIECIGKAIIYGLVCFFVLPHGLLTVVVGHFGMDFIGVLALKLIKHTLGARSPRSPQ